MSFANKKLLVVFGATGNQGGSVIRSILSDSIAAKQWEIRAVTRDTGKAAAVALAEQQGVEVFKADLEDKDSLYLALKNAYAVFAVTNFWEKMDPVAETRQGENIADVCKEMNVQHLVWSSLPNVSQITNNKLTAVVHFDGKALVDDYIRDLSLPHTILHVGVFTSFPVENLVPLSTSPSTFKLVFPQPASINSLIPLIDAAADTGKFVKAILMNPEKALGKTINAAERYYTLGEVIAVLKEVLGADVEFEAVDENIFKEALTMKGLPGFFQEDMLQLVRFVSEYGYFNGGGLENNREIMTEPLTSFEASMKKSNALAALKG